MFAAKQRALVLGKSRQVDPCHGNAARIGRIDAADEVQERRLAGSAAASQCHRLAAADLHLESVEHDVLALAFTKATAEPVRLDFDGCH